MEDSAALYGFLIAAVVVCIVWVSYALRAFKGFARILNALRAGKNKTAPVSDDAIAPSFKSHYDQYIRPQVEIFEARRLETLKKMYMRLIIVALFAVPVLGLGLMHVVSSKTETWQTTVAGHEIRGTATSSGDSLIVVGGILTGVLVIWAFWPVWQYKDSIKEQIFPKIFSFFGSQWSYDPNGIGGACTVSRFKGLKVKESWSELQQIGKEQSGHDIMAEHMAFGVLPAHQQAATEDYLVGSYKDIPMSLFECVLTSREGSGKNRHTVEHFRGLVVTIAVPKRFTGHTIVRRDGGKLGNWLGKVLSGPGLNVKPVKLEDPRFESCYEVYGSDQVEARYLLSPSFMERLMELEDMFAAHHDQRCDIQCAFKDSKLLLTIPTMQGWFTIGSIFKPVSFIDEINLILKEMAQLFAIIDLLKLDDRTGL